MRRNQINKLFFICAILFFAIGCGKKNAPIKNDEQKMRYAFDHAYILSQIEMENLNLYLDSLSNLKDIKLIFYSVVNKDRLSNIDSLAEIQFRRLLLADNGALIFVSVSTKRNRILVGKKIHKLLTNDQLDSISSLMNPYFKDEEFYDGLKVGFKQIAFSVK